MEKEVAVVVATMEVQVLMDQLLGDHLTSAPAKHQWSPMLKE